MSRVCFLLFRIYWNFQVEAHRGLYLGRGDGDLTRAGWVMLRICGASFANFTGASHLNWWYPVSCWPNLLHCVVSQSHFPSSCHQERFGNQLGPCQKHTQGKNARLFLQKVPKYICLLLSTQSCDVLVACDLKRKSVRLKWIHKFEHSSRKYYNNKHKHVRFSCNACKHAKDVNWMRKFPYEISLFKQCPLH